MTDLIKAPWPDWETVALIGRGSYGSVYEIRRRLIDGDIETGAMKVISIPHNSSELEELYSEGYDADSIKATFQAYLKDIVAEYSMMRKMAGSANVVDCKDILYVPHNDNFGWDIYIRMELLTPLMKALPAQIPEETVIRVAHDMCSALILCQKHSILHRDIKPQNIFVSSYGDYKLGDFGIAKTSSKTTSGTIIGTYKYMAPEVFYNQPYGFSADIYSLGLVLYWMLNERRMPFVPLPPAQLLAGMDEKARYRRLAGEQIPLPLHGSDELKRIVLKACAHNKDQRYASAEAMLKDLEHLNHGAFLVGGAAAAAATQPGKQAAEAVQSTQAGVKTQTGANSAAASKDAKIKPADTNHNSGKGSSHLPIVESVMTPAVDNSAPFIPDQAANSPKKPAASKEKQAKPEKKKKSGKGFGLVAAIVAILLIGGAFAGMQLFKKQPVTMEDPSSTKPAGTLLAGQSSVNAESNNDSLGKTDWSKWVDKLPESVAKEEYEIEEITLYRSRTLETQISTEVSTMEGWELYDTVEAGEGYSPWSGWSDTAVSESASRQVETQTRYRYRTKETSTGTSSTKNGWTLYNTTYTQGDYGAWSDWSTTAVSKTDSRKVENKTQYRYRDISYVPGYSDWSSWSSWQNAAITGNDLTEVDTRTVYPYYFYYCTSCGISSRYAACAGVLCNQCGQPISESSRTIHWYDTPWGSSSQFIGGYQYWNWTSGSSRTQYRSRTRTATEVASYSSWSSWSDTTYTGSSTRQVESRKVYRYCDRVQAATYHFYRWGNWSDWSTSAVSETDERDVESATYYRYRDQVKTTTYYFRRWTEWTEYSETAVTPSDTVEVESKTQYRYKEK